MLVNAPTKNQWRLSKRLDLKQGAGHPNFGTLCKVMGVQDRLTRFLRNHSVVKNILHFAKTRGRQRINYLHIGKTGGTQIMHQLNIINSVNRKYYFQKRGHSFRRSNLPERELWFVSIRDPISRFQSGFYSRKRMGRPRLNRLWSEAEEWAFSVFPHATDLADALSPTHQNYDSAVRAMGAIDHVRRPMSWTLDGQILNPFFVIRQENLAGDLVKMLQALNIDFSLNISSDPLETHANPYEELGFIPFSAIGLKNLETWYQKDFDLLGRIETLMIDKWQV
jgi:hypothetical protein